MKKQNVLRKEKGVVLILVLAFMAMFGILTATYLIMTTNMSDAAQNSLESYQKAPKNPSADLQKGFQNLMTGSNNPANPIGPFGILENLYGDNITSNGGDSLQFRFYRLYAHYENYNTRDNLEPTAACVEINIGGSDEDHILNAGNVITFGPLPTNYDSSNSSNSCYNLYNKYLVNTSAVILRKEIEDVYPISGNDDVKIRVCRLTLQMTDPLKVFIEEAGSYLDNSWPFPKNENLPRYTDSGSGYDYVDLNAAGYYAINIRLNLPAFGGTGMGSFNPSDRLDAQASPMDDPTKRCFRLPYAFWANAAAPDLTPYQNQNGKVDFRTFWAFLKNRDFCPFATQVDETGNISTVPNFDDTGTHKWILAQTDSNRSDLSVRMNPSYTAADSRSLFLANYREISDTETQITPSFFRPDILSLMCDYIIDTENYDYAHSGDDLRDTEADTLAALRKLIPRPLPMDHWNFTGGNDYENHEDPEEPATTEIVKPLSMSAKEISQLSLNDIDSVRAAMGFKVWQFLYCLKNIQESTNPANNNNPLDVDNDGDGIKDGIWIPSGLPIRADENGKLYATFYSYTILDMDGRVNLNTAGTRDQNIAEAGGFNYDISKSLSALTNRFSALPDSVLNDPLSPWFNVDDLTGTFDWINDRSEKFVDDEGNDVFVHRGTGLGPASVNLRNAFGAMGFADSSLIANRLLYLRYLTSQTENLETELDRAKNNSKTAFFFDGKSSDAPNDSNRYGNPQPSRYYSDNMEKPTNPLNLSMDKTDRHQWILNYTDGLYKDDDHISDRLADPNDFIFPWRGKTRIVDYARAASFFPTFDFTDMGLRTYDPLGNEIITRSPNYDENPYLANPYRQTNGDNTFNVTILDSLLRPFDYDVSLSPLVRAILQTPDNATDSSIRNDSNGRQSLIDLQRNVTTTSSDIPVPSMAFPNGPEEDRDGVFGIRDLIRKYLFIEFYNVNKDTLFGDVKTSDTDKKRTLYLDYIKWRKTQNGDQEGADKLADLSDETFEALQNSDLFQKELRRALREINRNENGDDFNYSVYHKFYQKGLVSKIEAVTDQLYNLLPEEIQEGRRLDLNALSHKASWVDGEWDKDYYKTKLYSPDDEEYAEIHARGLTERMKYARGLYLLMMILTYEDRNAEKVRDFYNLDGSLGDSHSDFAKKYSDYLEGFDSNAFEDAAKPKASETAEAKEMVAHRIAQWAVNLVDFSDPDGTMTPFFYDPDPFDGWWAVNFGGDNDWRKNEEVGFAPLINTVDYPDADLYALFSHTQKADGTGDFVGYLQDPDRVINEDENFANWISNVDESFSDGEGNETPLKRTYRLNTDTYAGALARWLQGQATEDGEKVGKSDFGFRLVWGMERPDLLLTETLNLHDLGIADTKDDDGNQKRTTDSSPDDHFDQVRRPQGSTFLELYCAANPNIPQSPDLYTYDEDLGVWRLDVSRMTPAQPEMSPYQSREFPVWRVAISASAAPHGESGKKNERVVRKMKNSVLERLVGKKADFRTFSMQTLQFCNDPELQSDTSKKEVKDAWSPLDLCVSHILGPTFVTEDDKADKEEEVELDRIVWFANPGRNGGRYPSRENYPDATHLFWRVVENAENAKDPVLVSPNQYLVVVPEKDPRTLGSYCQNDSGGSKDADDAGCFNVWSKNRIDINRLYSEMDGKVYEDHLLNCVVMQAATHFGLTADNYEDNQNSASRRGLNISEPLWTGTTDPYKAITNKKIKIANDTSDSDWHGVEKYFTVSPYPDIPYDLPEEWGGNSTNNSPIAEEYLFGNGTIPGYRSAFVQRVADPNRPYHPILNPYLTVDWNMMDLTVFNGEAVTDSSENFSRPYVKADAGGSEDNFNDYIDRQSEDQNVLKVWTSDSVFGQNVTLPLNKYFSSRQWMNEEQKGFFPESLADGDKYRLNPWARPINPEALKAEKGTGLEETIEADTASKYYYYDGETDIMTEPSEGMRRQFAMPYAPKHSLGWHNNRGEMIKDSSADDKLAYIKRWYKNLENNYYLDCYLYKKDALDKRYENKDDSVYLGAYKDPMEHLVWNDAPFSNPAEILFVPASEPGRFGLEFIRKADEDGFSLAKLYRLKEDNRGRSLGSNGTAEIVKDEDEGGEGDEGGEEGSGGDEDSETDNEANLFGYSFKGEGTSGAKADEYFIGPYLNFFNSSATMGQSLNLAKLFDFAGIPSLYVGTKVFAGYDDDGQPIYASSLREPGKLNINTLRAAGWAGILGDENIDDSWTPYIGGGTGSGSFLDKREVVSKDNYLQESFAPFQPAHTLPLKTQFPEKFSTAMTDDDDQRVSLLPGDVTLLAEKDYQPLLDDQKDANNYYAASEELQKMSGLTTTRSNVFAVWMTVGYFEVEKAKPGKNMPCFDPDGNSLMGLRDNNGCLDLFGQNNDSYKYKKYYQAIYPDGYTYGKELGTTGIDTGGIERRRAFFLIDRSIPVDFRRGQSWNWDKTILFQREL